MIERPVPPFTITLWPAVSDDGIPMARARIDAGQWAFQAGAQYDPRDPEDFGRRAAGVISAITHYARSKGWIDA
jgi:hypothetical protein